MLSESYYRFFADKVPEKFIDMAKALGYENPTNQNILWIDF
ncbi:iron-containing alcohol dehydrogenase [Clostridium grantii]|uniref:Uncharacterized protein n=1 Tax=Clostridium grantii DSM 8605 TaxID=1121316 RepID=A0A1M5T045_9CLOT|nr:iron-containing alcohol dehydrogenase [Clostridium grantii]SHH43978.1 hypothetical protein SAMN02745207_01126 [Clostridium grantii DSM 8605]